MSTQIAASQTLELSGCVPHNFKHALALSYLSYNTATKDCPNLYSFVAIGFVPATRFPGPVREQDSVE